MQARRLRQLREYFLKMAEACKKEAVAGSVRHKAYHAGKHAVYESVAQIMAQTAGEAEVEEKALDELCERVRKVHGR